jgi:hypothetical protein
MTLVFVDRTTNLDCAARQLSRIDGCQTQRCKLGTNGTFSDAIESTVADFLPVLWFPFPKDAVPQGFHCDASLGGWRIHNAPRRFLIG